MLTKTYSYCAGGFALSLLFSIGAGFGLQFILDSIWVSPESFIAIYSSSFAIAIAAVGLTWSCLLRGLQNRAMIRGVWGHIYLTALLSTIGLFAMLFF